MLFRKKFTNRALSVFIFLIMLAALSMNSFALNKHGSKCKTNNQMCKKHWVGTWATSPQDGEAIIPGILEPSIREISDGTIRQIVHTSIEGNIVRIRLSNEFGKVPINIGSASIALSKGGESINARTKCNVRFGGKTSIVIEPGKTVVSDAIRLNIKALSDVAVSIYFPQKTPITTYHSNGFHTTYIASGNQTNAAVLPTTTTSTNYFFLTGIDVMSSKKAASIVAFGDSLTDGNGSTINENKQWSNVLAARLQNNKKYKHLSVLNCGISGNRLLNDIIGTSGLNRMESDVLNQEGVKYIIFEMGLNDLGYSGGAFGSPGGVITADDIITGYKKIIAMAHKKGCKIIGTTLTPCNGLSAIIGGGQYDSPEGQSTHKAVNEWIRTSGDFDAVIDFEKAVCDPNDPTKLLPAYDSGDHAHLNDAGYEVLANSIDLNLFK